MVQFWSFVTHVFFILMLAVWIFNTQLLPKPPYLWHSVCAQWGTEAFMVWNIFYASHKHQILRWGYSKDRRQPINTAFCYSQKHIIVWSPSINFTLEAALSFAAFKSLFNVLCGSFVYVEDFFFKNINRLWARLVISKYGYLERGWLQAVLLNPTGRVWALQDTHAADHRQTTLN